jgi:hypothetical protein
VSVGGIRFLESLPERYANMHSCQVNNRQSAFLLCNGSVQKLVLCFAVDSESLLQEFCQCDAIFFPVDSAAQNLLSFSTEK